jgi:tyrosyl-tRNA synthetase
VVTRSILRPYIFIRAFFNAQKRKYILEERKMTLYEELVARGLIAQVTNEEEISRLINEGKATFYIGFDPTADSLHVGHFMALCLMKRLQMGGNKPIALIGGGTAMIGDPSGRTDMRQMMTKETIQHNCDCFKKQMSRFIDFSEGKALMVNNADWLLDLNYIEVLREVGAHFSVNRMLTAECYKQRMEKGLSFLEFNYMIMQSYDFYALFQKYGCNLQFGGDDQWSNMLGGTELIRRKLGKDAHAMTITLLLNSEGKKMGKTIAPTVPIPNSNDKSTIALAFAVPYLIVLTHFRIITPYIQPYGNSSFPSSIRTPLRNHPV